MGADLGLDRHSSLPYWGLFRRVFQFVRGKLDGSAREPQRPTPEPSSMRRWLATHFVDVTLTFRQHALNDVTQHSLTDLSAPNNAYGPAASLVLGGAVS